jgi:hypothetical protein
LGVNPENIISPFRIGDRLWVRETWRVDLVADAAAITYMADGDNIDPVTGRPWHWPAREHTDDAVSLAAQSNPRWRSPIHMPRWASRLTLEVADVRAERLQDITEADAIAEGCQPLDPTCPACPSGACSAHQPAVEQYRTLWNSIHGPGAWDKNPWVWVIGFMAVDEKAGGGA